MKEQLYKIRTVPAKFDREGYMKIYKKLVSINQKTSELISELLKCGVNKDDNIIRYNKSMVQHYRGKLEDFFVYGYKAFSRKDLGEEHTTSLNPNTDELMTALQRLKQDLRDERRRRRQIRNEYFIHNEFGHWLNRQLQKTYGSLDENKRPRTEDRYLGIEIECIIPTDSDIKKLMLPLAKYVSLAHDGSIDASEFNDESGCDCGDPDDCSEDHGSNQYEGREIRVLVKESELNTVLPKICSVLDEIGAKVNKSCGLHVHFDMRWANYEQRGTIYSKLYHSLPLLTQIVPKTRRKNTYCTRNRRSTPNYNGRRYKMINVASYNKHHTFEIRLFNSSTNAHKIINWINLLQGIMKSEIYLRCPSSFKKAKALWGLSDGLVAWAEARKEKFKAPVQDTNEPVLNGAMLDNVVIDETPIVERREVHNLGPITVPASFTSIDEPTRNLWSNYVTSSIAPLTFTALRQVVENIRTEENENV